jgi:hypothetical protein
MRYYTYITAFFVSVILISNIVSTKITSFLGFTFDGGTILFPLSYIFGDVLTEVYGYKKTKKVIWIGFFCALLMSFIIILVGLLPPGAGWDNQEAYEKILGLTPRIVFASLIAYLVGEFSNSIILARLKVFFEGKKLWVRTIGSSIVGQGLDTVIFIFIAFYGLFPIWILIISNYIFKLLVEIAFTPFTYVIVNWLKKVEKQDHFDYKTKFSMF